MAYLVGAAVLCVHDNTSMARWLQARLVPDHKDALATQRAANGAALAGLSEAQHQALLGRESLLPAAEPRPCLRG